MLYAKHASSSPCKVHPIRIRLIQTSRICLGSASPRFSRCCFMLTVSVKKSMCLQADSRNSCGANRGYDAP